MSFTKTTSPGNFIEVGVCPNSGIILAGGRCYGTSRTGTEPEVTDADLQSKPIKSLLQMCLLGSYIFLNIKISRPVAKSGTIFITSESLDRTSLVAQW